MTIPYTLRGGPGDLPGVVTGIPREWFATVDGALVPGLAGRLSELGLVCRPLYIEGADAEAVTNGPWLVWTPEPRSVARLLSLTGDGPSPVFWSWREGADSLYRHLRRKAMVHLPLDDGRKPPWEPVLFRHADPNALAIVLPVLTPEQQSSFLGPALALAFWSPDACGLVAVRRPEGLLPVERQTLRFTAEQYAAIEANRVVRNRRRVMSYLRRVAASVVGAWSEDELWRSACEAEEAGRKVGLRTEYSHWLWGYLWVLSGRSMPSEILNMLKGGGDNTDEVLRSSIDAVALLQRENVA